MTTRLATSFIALSTAFAAPAFADVSAADVFSNQQAYYSALGMTLNGEIVGDQVTSPEINIIFPQGIASLQITADNISLIENRDGTVTISYPSPLNASVKGGVSGEVSFSADFVMTHNGYDIVAAGDPGDITYESIGQDVRFKLVDFAIDEGLVDEVSADLNIQIDGWASKTRITEGNLITVSSSVELGENSVNYNGSMDGIESRNSQTTLPTVTTTAMTLPAGGSDLMNLAAAIRDGLTVFMESEGEGNSSETLTLLNGSTMNSQSTSTGAQTFTLSLDEAGLTMDVDAAEFGLSMNEPMLFPGDIVVAAQAVTANYDIPLSASEDQQDFRVATSISGLTLGDELWNLFDPSAMLPRDPGEVSYDITGSGTLGLDLLNFAAMAEMFGPPPIEVDQVTIENLRIAAAGVDATATGAMTFDWTDFQTIPGMARPEGQVTLNVNGANQLMDNLAAMGLIREEDLMMPRMMMGMFSTPVGDDKLETVFEVNSEGHVLANGQRLQ